MEEGVVEKQDDKSERTDEGKDTAFPDGTPPGDMEEGVVGKKYDKSERIDE